MRERAKEILSAVPPLGQQINSDGPTAALFTKLTGGVTHMGISLDLEGDTWNTVQSGQGGPKAKRDIIKRKQTTYDASKLQGWVDLELYFGSGRTNCAQSPNG